jgi:glycerate dehydrogenase
MHFSRISARGGIVNEAALVQALRFAHLGGVGVDVLSAEPTRQGNPPLEPGVPNPIVTPRCAWGASQALQRVIHLPVENVKSFQSGCPVRSGVEPIATGERLGCHRRPARL